MCAPGTGWEGRRAGGCPGRPGHCLLARLSGAEIYLKAAGSYVALGQPVSAYTVVEAARRRGEVALGYHLKALAGDAAKHHGVALNPEKPGKIAFAAGDRVIVLAND